MMSFIAAIAMAHLGPNAATAPKIEVVMEKGGTFVIETVPDKSPKTVEGILAFVKDKFYDEQRVHRVEDWVTQWGAPASKDKDLDSMEVLGGGSGKNLVFEASDVSFLRGTVGIASKGAKTGGDCQLFIVKRDSAFLDGSYAVLGRVIEGIDVVDKITRGDRIKSMQIKKEEE